MEAARSGGTCSPPSGRRSRFLRVLRLSRQAAELAGLVAGMGMQASVSDSGVAASAARTAAEGACLNVLINLGEIEDAEYRRSVKAQALALLDETTEAAGATFGKIRMLLRPRRIAGTRNEKKPLPRTGTAGGPFGGAGGVLQKGQGRHPSHDMPGGKRPPWRVNEQAWRYWPFYGARRMLTPRTPTGGAETDRGEPRPHISGSLFRSGRAWLFQP